MKRGHDLQNTYAIKDSANTQQRKRRRARSVLSIVSDDFTRRARRLPLTLLTRLFLLPATSQLSSSSALSNNVSKSIGTINLLLVAR